MKPRTKPKMIIFIFSLVIGIAALWMGSKLLKNYFHVKDWKQTDATVLSKKVEEQDGLYLVVKVEFKYLFNGKEYTNNMVYASELTGGIVRRDKNRLPRFGGPYDVVEKLQNQITVYVNPENPAQSFIFREGFLIPVFAVLIGIILLFYCLVTFINWL